MSANSRIKKYIHVEADGTSINVPGLYIDEVTGTFIARAYFKGSTKSKSLKTKVFSVARTKVMGAIKSILNKDYRDKSNKLVEDYYESFWESLVGEDLSQSTMTRYSVSWRHHVAPFWGKLREDQINQETYTAYLKWFKKKSPNDKIFNHLKCLRGLIRHMVRSNARVGVVDAFLPKKEADSNAESKGTYIETEEIRAILKVKDLTPRERLQIELGYTFGMRIGEIVNLKKDRIKVFGTQVQIHLKSQDTKTRKARIIPLTENLGERLLEVSKSVSGENVFPGIIQRKKPMSKQVLERAWVVAKEKAGIRRKIRFHDLRHTAATNFADIGLDPVKACAILGMTLKIYMGTYVKNQSLNLSSVIDTIEKQGGIL